MLFQPRQFPRVSLATEVKVQCGDEVFVARSQEIGAGGMALQNAEPPLGGAAGAAFLHPVFGLELKLDAVVWWKRDHRVGIRFDPRDPKCRLIQQWVEEQIKLARTPQV